MSAPVLSPNVLVGGWDDDGSDDFVFEKTTFGGDAGGALGRPEGGTGAFGGATRRAGVQQERQGRAAADIISDILNKYFVKPSVRAPLRSTLKKSAVARNSSSGGPKTPRSRSTRVVEQQQQQQSQSNQEALLSRSEVSFDLTAVPRLGDGVHHLCVLLDLLHLFSGTQLPTAGSANHQHRHVLITLTNVAIIGALARFHAATYGFVVSVAAMKRWARLELGVKNSVVIEEAARWLQQRADDMSAAALASNERSRARSFKVVTCTALMDSNALLASLLDPSGVVREVVKHVLLAFGMRSPFERDSELAKCQDAAADLRDDFEKWQIAIADGGTDGTRGEESEDCLVAFGASAAEQAITIFGKSIMRVATATSSSSQSSASRLKDSATALELLLDAICVKIGLATLGTNPRVKRIADRLGHFIEHGIVAADVPPTTASAKDTKKKQLALSAHLFVPFITLPGGAERKPNDEMSSSASTAPEKDRPSHTRHQCDVCGAVFTAKARLATHMKSHQAVLSRRALGAPAQDRGGQEEGNNGTAEQTAGVMRFTAFPKPLPATPINVAKRRSLWAAAAVAHTASTSNGMQLMPPSGTLSSDLTQAQQTSAAVVDRLYTISDNNNIRPRGLTIVAARVVHVLRYVKEKLIRDNQRKGFHAMSATAVRRECVQFVCEHLGDLVGITEALLEAWVDGKLESHLQKHPFTLVEASTRSSTADGQLSHQADVEDGSNDGNWVDIAIDSEDDADGDGSGSGELDRYVASDTLKRYRMASWGSGGSISKLAEGLTALAAVLPN